MNYLVIGLNHKTAPLAVREKIAFREEVLPLALRSLIAETALDEGIILSTCNRVEVYAASPHGASPDEVSVGSIQHFLSRYHQIESRLLDPCFYQFLDKEAVRHLFRVTASLDSMVVGESQIVAQVKKAYLCALHSKTSGPFLNRCFERALSVSKRVRRETHISSKTASTAKASLFLAQQIFGSLSQKKVALLGIGKIGELVVSYLEGEGVSEVTLLNRNFKRALELAEDGVGVAVPFEKREEIMEEVDLVISSLTLDQPLITKEFVDRLMEIRKGRPMFFIDLGVPRNIEENVNKVPNVYLYNIDDLQQVSRDQEARFQNEILRAEAIVEKEAASFYETMIHHEPALSLLGKKFESIRRRELSKTLARLDHLTLEEKIAVERCTEAIVNKIIEDPAMALKKGTEGRLHASDLLKRLFRLDDE